MSLSQTFKLFIASENLFHPEAGLLLAISGGVDSVALVKLCVDAGFKAAVAHANFQLRGAESERDEQFVKKLANDLGLDFVSKKFQTEQYAAAEKISIQVAARQLRYAWFDELLQHTFRAPAYRPTEKQFEPSFIVTAHHADDNIETALLNYFKGTGIRGMRGMLPKQGKVIRPLLFAKKEEMVDFVAQQRLGFVEDSSNASDKYSRNFLRHQLIPVLRNIYPEVEANLYENLARFRETEELFMEAVVAQKKKLLETKGGEVHIPVEKLRKVKSLPTIVYEIIRDFGFEAPQVNEVIRLLDSGSGKYVLSPTHRILKNRNWLLISPLAKPAVAEIVVVEQPGQFSFDAGMLNVQAMLKQPNGIVADPMVAMLDSRDIQFPLLLRKWKAGDYFYPLGMKKKKKLSRFFIDQKMSLAEKEKAWVLEMNRKIIWVLGKRIDERFKLREDSQNCLRLEFRPS